MAAPKKYPDELRARAVRLYRSTTPRPTFRQLGEQLGVHHEALRNWVRQAEADAGERDDRPTSSENEELRVNGHRFLPDGGHEFSPLAASRAPHGRPAVLPSRSVG